MRSLRTSSIALALALAGCDFRSARQLADSVAVAEHAAPEVRRAGFVQRQATLPVAFQLFPATTAASSTRMVLRSGQASVEVDSLEVAVGAVQQLARSAGGFVANSSLQATKQLAHSATLQLRLPAEQLDAALAGLRSLGRVESVNVEAEDVGEEYVDVTARTANDRRLESRLLDILAHRTGRLKDVLDVEQQLARVREEIERYQGRLRYLQQHAALSTLAVTVHEPVTVVGQVDSGVMGAAFKQAWRNFVGLLAFLVEALGIVLPIGALAAAGWLAVGRLRVTS